MRGKKGKKWWKSGKQKLWPQNAAEIEEELVCPVKRREIMRVIPKTIWIQSKPMTNTHYNTESVRGEIQSKYSNIDPDQAASLGMKETTEKKKSVKGRLEVSQLITNHYYLERKGMLSVNG